MKVRYVSLYRCFFSPTIYLIGRAIGDRLKLSDIKKLLGEDPDLQDLSREQEQVFIDKLVAHRELKKGGARATNHAAAADTRYTIDIIGSKVWAFILTVTLTGLHRAILLA